MRILFTGASSFTGMWFVQELAKEGHNITATFLRPHDQYQDLRKNRVDNVLEICEPVFDCPFGSPKFLETIKKESHWDLLCHHASDVADYKSQEFDFAKALEKNTFNIKGVLPLLKKNNCHKILLTGSVFEQREGQGSIEAVSPYGLSKGLTSDVFRYFCSVYGLHLGKFVIPNPFGPYEEFRFTSYLAQNWLQNKDVTVSSPDYVRDNIPVSLLAKVYATFANQLPTEPGYRSINPSYRPESQGEFTRYFAAQMKKRLPVACNFHLAKQMEFPEPKIRINTDQVNVAASKWDENGFWDDLAEYYMQNYPKEIL